jgi:hypothetical protein
MTNELIKAIWKSGFRAGYEDGAGDQLNYVWGGVGPLPAPKKDGRNGWFLTLMAVPIMRLT